jgi:class 3 adenylate cyclase/tetratricopeptide (TPR) repeat protein
MPDLRSWLQDLSLDGYFEKFVENKIDSDILPDLTESDLEKLQMPLGDRKRLLRAIHGLLDEAVAEGRPARGHGEQLRYLTVMFIDLVGSTALSEKLDLEDYWTLITDFQLFCTNVIRDFHGFPAKYIGDGVLAYFGYPKAAESDAERAVAAGLEVARSVGSIDNQRGLKIEARVGIATGKVVVCQLAKGQLEIRDTALGDTPNLAARLQTIAVPGTVLISQSTQELLGNRFECTDMGKQALKGFSEPVPVWQARKVHSATSRFDNRQKGPLTPLSGRDEELTLLVNRWRSATEGEGRVLLISGEAGIGKSRIVEALCDRIKDEPHFRLSYHCSPFHTRSAFYPVIAQLSHAADIRLEDSSQEKLDKLEEMMGRAGTDVRPIAPLFSRLLSIPGEDRYGPLEGTAETLNEAMKSALLEQLFGLAGKKPVVVTFDDIQWIDPSTEELLGTLIKQIESGRILLVCSYRPEYQAPWTGQAGVLTIHLNRLDRRQSLEMIRQLCGNRLLPPPMAKSIVAKTEGVPLFIEELTKSVLSGREKGEPGDDGAGNGAAPLTLPSTLNELLTAKLDSLPGGEDVVPLCAAIGRTFTAKILSVVSGLPDDRLRSVLDDLVRSQILLQRGDWPDAVFSFRHALIQEAAYATMLKSRAKSLHASIADALVSRTPEISTRSPEIVAHHYSRAKMPKEARDFWMSAGTLAIEHSAYLEAIAHLEAALQENEKVFDEKDRVANEIALREKLVIPLEARFWGSEDIAINLDRLHQLQSDHGGKGELFAVLDGLYGTHIISGNADLALDYALKMTDIAKSQNDAAFSLMSLHAMGMCHFARGEFDEATKFFASAIQLRSRASETVMKNYYLADVEVIDRCMQSWAYVLGGKTALAEKAIERARAITEAADHEFSQAYGFSVLASIHQETGDVSACLDFAGLALDLSERNRFRYWEAWAQIMHGWATAASGEHDRGFEKLAAGLEIYTETGSKQIVAYGKTLLADAYLRAGRIKNGLSLIEEIEAAQDETSVRFHRGITARVANELRLASEAAGAGAAV